MKLLIVGCGSIGLRHLGNLKSLSQAELLAFDISEVRRKETELKFGARSFASFEQALAEKPDAVFVCTPTSLHLSYALEAAKNGCHLFVEKPLSHTMDGIEDLIGAVSDKVLLVGCNFRFHRGIKLARQLFSENKIGRVLFAQAEFGQYLPDWHPWEDYRQGYSANRGLGGGIILDSIHELDYLYWFFGRANEVSCTAGKLGSLDIDVEDTAEIVVNFSGGVMASVHLDYLQRAYTRTLKIVGEEGTITWDFTGNMVKLYSAEEKHWQVFQEKAPYDVNEMYIEEMKHFLRCLEGKEAPTTNVHDGKNILEIALAARQSAESHRSITL